MNRGRVVFSPYGPPQHSETAERYSGALLQCGADLQRIFDDPRGSVAAFAQHVSAIRALSSPDLSALVVLTRCVPVLESVVTVRRMLEAKVPVLENAPWLIYCDPLREPSTFTALSQGGTLEDDLESAPIWKGPDGLRYLVLSPLIPPEAESNLLNRVRLVEYGTVGESGPVAISPHPSERPTVPVPAFTEQYPTLRVGAGRRQAG
jgi:hypothetical protein